MGFFCIIVVGLISTIIRRMFFMIAVQLDLAVLVSKLILQELLTEQPSLSF